MNDPDTTKIGGLQFANADSVPDYGESAPRANATEFTYIEMLARVDAAEGEVAAAEAVLKDKKEALRVLVEEALPARMRELGADKVTLPTGEVLYVDTGTYASVAVPKGAKQPERDAVKERLVEFLDQNNEGACVDRAFVVGVGKNSAETIDNIHEALRGMPGGEDLDTKVEVRIPPSSLSAMARRWVEAGRALPNDLISVYTKTELKVKRPKV